jgi:hypothetical protein
MTGMSVLAKHARTGKSSGIANENLSTNSLKNTCISETQEPPQLKAWSGMTIYDLREAPSVPFKSMVGESVFS